MYNDFIMNSGMIKCPVKKITNEYVYSLLLLALIHMRLKNGEIKKNKTCGNK